MPDPTTIASASRSPAGLVARVRHHATRIGPETRTGVAGGLDWQVDALALCDLAESLERAVEHEVSSYQRFVKHTESFTGGSLLHYKELLASRDETERLRQQAEARVAELERENTALRSKNRTYDRQRRRKMDQRHAIKGELEAETALREALEARVAALEGCLEEAGEYLAWVHEHCDDGCSHHARACGYIERIDAALAATREAPTQTEGESHE